VSWAKLDDHFYCHRKVLAAGLAATGLFSRSLSYAAAHETNGQIAREVADLLSYGDAELCTRLVDVGLWEAAGDGYLVHDYLRFNPSARQLEKQRRETAARVRKYRQRNESGRAARSADVTRNGSESVTRETRRPVTMGRVGSGSASGSLLPSDSGSGRRGVGRKAAAPSDFERFWHAYPKRKNKQDALNAWLKLAPDAAVLEAIEAALVWQRVQPDWVKEGGQFVPYPATYLNGRRWEDEPTEAGRLSSAAAQTVANLQDFARRGIA
jgi:hypothetical protein